MQSGGRIEESAYSFKWQKMNVKIKETVACKVVCQDVAMCCVKDTRE